MELFCAMQEMVAVSLLVIYFLGFVKNRRKFPLHMYNSLKDRKLIRYETVQ